MNKSSKISDEDRKLFRDTVGNTKPIKDNNVITDNSKTPPYSKKIRKNILILTTK